MRTISINKDSKTLSFDKSKKVFYGSEKDIPFDTTYNVVNTDTKQFRVFEFSHSTGPEFDPKTQWIYKNSVDDVQLIICNDTKITRQNAENYLKAKTSID